MWRSTIFKEIKLKKGGQAHYFTEVTFNHVDNSSRFDGLVVVVIGKKIVDAAVFEMKNKDNHSHLGLLKLKGEGAHGNFSKIF